MRKGLKNSTLLIGGLLGTATFVVVIKNVIDARKEESQGREQGFYEKYVKRPLDFFCAGAATIVLSPVLATTAVLVKTKLGSPVLFSQDRPGKNGKIFKLYKFRSMTDQRDENGELLPDDLRLTGLGKVLRATSIDELPGLFSVIKGDMAIIGPRPLLVEYMNLYPEKYLERHSVRPGLELPPPEGRNYFTTWREQFEQDVWYTKHISFMTDIKMVIRTAKMVIDAKNNKVRTNALRPKFNGKNIDQSITQ